MGSSHTFGKRTLVRTSHIFSTSIITLYRGAIQVHIDRSQAVFSCVGWTHLYLIRYGDRFLQIVKYRHWLSTT
jgi:hypothetical protein